MHGSAPELYDLARAALNEQRTDDAAQLIARALRLHPDPELRLRLRTSRAWVTWVRSGQRAALRELQAVVSDAQSGGLFDVAAAAQVQKGTLHARAGELDQAWQALNQADGQALPAQDRLRLVLNRGTIASEIGRFDDASADLAHAAALAADLGLAPLEFMARHNRGWVDYLRGDLPGALKGMREADAMEVELDRSVARLDRARVLLEAGLVDEAVELLHQAMEHQDGPHRSAEIQLDLARCELLRGRAEESYALASAARRVFSRRHSALWRRRAIAAQLAARPQVRLATQLHAEATASHDHDVAAQAALSATQALLRSGRVEALAPFLADLRAGQRSPTLSTSLAVALVLARAALARGDLPAARRIVRGSSTTLLRAQHGLASLDLRTAVALHGEEAADLDRRLARDRGAIALLEATERWRAVANVVPGVYPTDDPQVVVITARLRALHAEARAQPTPSAETLRALTAAENDLRALSWGSSTPLPAAARPLSHAAIRRVTRERGATLVAFTRVDDRALAVVVGDRPTRMVDLGPVSAVDAAAAVVRADLTSHARLGPGHPLAATVAASLQASLQRIADLVLSRLQLPPGPLAVVASRSLTGVPWLALPGLEGRAVTLARSASSWVGRHSAVSQISAAVLIGPDLSCAEQEATAVRQTWAAVASDDLLSALADHDLVHVAAHGEHRGDNPLFSSLRLAHGKVFAHEFEGKPLRASHVVLSACEVGRAIDRPGDQPLGFTGCLLAAGVVCVVAPVAPVADQLAATVMTDYHRALLCGHDAATALAMATLGRPGAGAFTCFGSPWQAAS